MSFSVEESPFLDKISSHHVSKMSGEDLPVSTDMYLAVYLKFQPSERQFRYRNRFLPKSCRGWFGGSQLA